MSKYDFQLDMNTDNSNSVILRNINPNSKVLEVGCAHGRMTKYLSEDLRCQVYISELDNEAGKIASQWTIDSFIGEEGDIERISFFDDLNSLAYNNFDYIIFADVLEHLHNPQYVLNESKKVLKENGSIWISVPNLGHNSVLIDLWNDEFTYRDVGLLDNTHIHFFTRKSLEKMVDACGLRINQEINLKNAVENTEFHNTYDNVPEEVAALMKHRENGEVYQFVWELKK